MQTPKDFLLNPDGLVFEKPSSYSILEIPVLQFLEDQPFDELALAYISTLKPTVLRVTPRNRAVHCDSQPGRVTVYLKPETETIWGIYQESIIGLYGKFENAQHIHDELERRLS